MERPADGHRLAHRFHRGGQFGLRAGEFFKGEARDLRHDIVDGRLEGRRGDAGDVIVQLVQRIADRQLRRDLGDGKTGGLGRQRGGPRHARVHLDHHDAPVFRIDRELDVRSARLHPDLPQHRDGGGAEHLVFLVRKGQRRCDRDAVAGVDAHRVDVFDGADDDRVVRLVADDLHLELLPAEKALVDQDLGNGGGVEPGLADRQIILAVIGDAAAGAAKGEGGADDGGKADLVQRGDAFFHALGDGGLGVFKPDAIHRLPEQLPVLSHLDGFLVGADQLNPQAVERAVLGEAHCRVQTSLPAHGRQQHHLLVRMLGDFLLDDPGDDLRRDRLDIGGVGHAGVGHDRRGVRVDEDDAIPFLPQRLAGLRAGIVKLASLTDDDGPRADDHHRIDIVAFGHGGAPRQDQNSRSRVRIGPVIGITGWGARRQAPVLRRECLADMSGCGCGCVGHSGAGPDSGASNLRHNNAQLKSLVTREFRAGAPG